MLLKISFTAFLRLYYVYIFIIIIIITRYELGYNRPASALILVSAKVFQVVFYHIFCISYFCY